MNGANPSNKIERKKESKSCVGRNKESKVSKIKEERFSEIRINERK